MQFSIKINCILKNLYSSNNPKRGRTRRSVNLKLVFVYLAGYDMFSYVYICGVCLIANRVYNNKH